MATLYDVLDVPPDATAEELRRGYHRAARLLHPDLNSNAGTSDAMRRLNAAWAVLGDPEQRRRYDARIGIPKPTGRRADQDRPRRPADRSPLPHHPLSRLLRPSVVVVSVLALIFVITAYVGPHHHAGAPTGVTSTSVPSPNVTTATPPPPATPGDAQAPSTLMGQCILPLMGYDAVVPCTQAGSKLVVESVSRGADCPAGSTLYQLEGRQQLVCLETPGR